MSRVFLHVTNTEFIHKDDSFPNWGFVSIPLSDGTHLVCIPNGEATEVRHVFKFHPSVQSHIISVLPTVSSGQEISTTTIASFEAHHGRKHTEKGAYHALNHMYEHTGVTWFMPDHAA